MAFSLENLPKYHFKNIREYVGMQLDLLCLLNFPVKKRLKGKPRKFYVESIILHMIGVNLDSTDAVEHLREYMDWKMSDDVYTYRYKLKRKGWLLVDPKVTSRFKLLPLFDYREKGLPKEKVYAFTLTYDDEEEEKEKVQKQS